MSTAAPSDMIEQESGSLSGQNKLMQGLLIAAIVASGLSMIFSLGTAFVSASQDSTTSVALVETVMD
ncbi:MAG: hypothetical protein JJ974_11355 [Phycisphaerales bacterium]|nr:hypothetical protein [Phycisphaerales bacterium]